MPNQKILLILTFFLAVVFLSLSVVPLLPKSPKTTTTPDILFLTQPVTSFTGKVEKTEGNTITVSRTVTLPSPTPLTKTFSYQVEITKNTQINQSPSIVPLLFSTPAAQLKKTPTVKDIKTGQMILIRLDSDLRTFTSGKLTALSVDLPPPRDVLIGKITIITNNTLTLKAAAAPSSAYPLGSEMTASLPKEQEYTVKIAGNTEISRFEQATNANNINNPPKAVKMAVSDLKTNLPVKVYIGEDATSSNQLTALRIEPILNQ